MNKCKISRNISKTLLKTTYCSGKMIDSLLFKSKYPFASKVNKISFLSHFSSLSKSSYSKQKPLKPIQQTKTQLSQIIQQQIKSQQANLYDQSQYTQLLNYIDWKIKKNNSILQLTKSTSTHQFHAFITIKPPVEMNSQTKQFRIQQKNMEIQILQEQLKNKYTPSIKKHLQYLKQFLKSNHLDEPFAQITIFVHKTKPKSKYLCLEYLSNSKYSQIEQMSILQKIVPSRIQRLQQCHQYTGRALTMLDIDTAEMIFLLTQTQYELRKQVLQTIFQLTCCYQQQQYLNWLKSLHQIL